MASAAKNLSVDSDKWNVAIIAPHEHVIKFHDHNAGAVSKFAGQCIRVRPSAEKNVRRSFICHGINLDVHPEDVKKFWPDMPRAVICDCRVFTD